jgi:hypothetical protein
VNALADARERLDAARRTAGEDIAADFSARPPSGDARLGADLNGSAGLVIGSANNGDAASVLAAFGRASVINSDRVCEAGEENSSAGR